MSNEFEKTLENAGLTYQKLEKRHGKQNKDWELIMQSTDGEFDYMQIKLADGTIKTEKIKLVKPF